MRRPNEAVRLWRAAFHALAGIRAAVAQEPSFRLEAMAAAALLPSTFFFSITSAERCILVASVLLVLIVELLNTAIEKTLDRLSTDWHPLTKQAKDMGSAAVLLSLLMAAYCWTAILF